MTRSDGKPSAITWDTWVWIDDEANDCRGQLRMISTENSKVKVMILPTNEELAIARETLRLVQ